MKNNRKNNHLLTPLALFDITKAFNFFLDLFSARNASDNDLISCKNMLKILESNHKLLTTNGMNTSFRSLISSRNEMSLSLNLLNSNKNQVRHKRIAK